MFRYFIIAFLSLTLWACGNDEGTEIAPSGTAYWNNSSSISAEKGNAAIRMEGTAGTQWEAEITEGKNGVLSLFHRKCLIKKVHWQRE